MDKIDKYILRNWHKKVQTLATALGISSSTVALRKRKIVAEGKTPQQDSIKISRERHKEVSALALLREREKKMVQEVERLEKEMLATKAIKEISSYTIKPKSKKGESEAIAVIVASDWHIEEKVKSEQVSGLNEFNLEIASRRIEQFWQTALRMVQIFQKDIKIETAIIALLGDFISGSIHDELMEGNLLLPMNAIRQAQEHIVSGLEFLLKHTRLNFVIPCHSGNHGRVTKKQRHATEAGNSLEYLMYHNLAMYFKGEKRIKFVISEGYHSYIEVFGYTLRFHHGHSIKFGGGIGGIFIPAFKAISQWNKARQADWDVFGHFHSRKDGGNFLCNGSVIGYNAFALSIKADFEKSSQLLFLIDKKRGRTITAPIILE